MVRLGRAWGSHVGSAYRGAIGGQSLLQHAINPVKESVVPPSTHVLVVESHNRYLVLLVDPEFVARAPVIVIAALEAEVLYQQPV